MVSATSIILHAATRANYVSRLRRAFFLRVHPDLFRNHDSCIRSKQSKLFQALSNRMAQADFAAWQSYRKVQQPLSAHSQSNNREDALPYVIQKRDGTLLRHKINLSLPADKILYSMSDALAQSGAGASLPPFPSDENCSPTSTTKGGERGNIDDVVGAIHKSDGHAVDRRYDVFSNRGRSLGHFLERLDIKEVEQRKCSRLVAQAVASQVRRLYQFQAVDATTLGWSSASVTVLFQRLLDLHAEHGHKLRVDSFHPLRLVFTYDNDGQSKVEKHGGLLHLSPASTPLQWLTHLQLVTPPVLEEIRWRRDRVMQMQKILQSSWGLKWKKGYSCSSLDFFNFVARLTQSLSEIPNPEHHSLVPEQLVVTIESPQQCRRPITTPDGAIRLGHDMTEVEVRSAISRLRPSATRKTTRIQAEHSRCNALAREATWLFGLSGLDYRITGVLHPEQVSEALSRLIRHSDRFKHNLAGHAVGIVGSGHFCHLGDDGTINIPHDWT